MSFQFDDDPAYRVHRVLDIDDTCELSDVVKDEEIEKLKGLIEIEPNKLLKEAFVQELEDLKRKKKSKRPRAPVDSKTEEVLEHPAYYITSEQKNICFNANTMNDLGKARSKWYHGTSKKFQNPPHHDFEKVQERFFRSAQKGDATEIQFLIKMGADIDIKNDKGETALFTAASNGHVEVLEELLRAGAKKEMYDSDQGRTPLLAAARLGHKDVVTALLNAKADVDKQDEHGLGQTSLIYAATFGYKDIVTALLDAKANVNKQDKYGQTPLLCAAYLCHKDIVTALLNAKADVNKQDIRGQTPLLCASQNGYATAARERNDIVTALLNAKADVNKQDVKGRIPLHYAANYGHKDIVTALLNAEADVNKQDVKGRIPLHYAAKYGRKDVVTALLNSKADVNKQDEKGQTPLHLACKNPGAVEEIVKIVDMLVNKGADVNAKDTNGNTLFHLLRIWAPYVYGVLAKRNDQIIERLKNVIDESIKNNDGLRYDEIYRLYFRKTKPAIGGDKSKYHR